MLKHITAGTPTRVTRGDQVPPTPPLTAKVVGIPTMEVNKYNIDTISKTLSNVIIRNIYKG